ncbi:MAG: hypothetical protein P0120_07105 [Nitrospira sp.]|nr:hypothetical protein [Nitrospira sp.]
MGRTLTRNFLLLVWLILPLPLWADPNLDYQNRGDRFEGVKPKPVSGYDIEVISVLADYQEPATQLPDQLRVWFYLQSQTPVHLTVREQDYRLYYWLDKVKPAKGWQAKSVNEYTWPTGAVLRQLDQKLNPYELGVLIRLGKETPAENEEIAPAILYHARPPDKINGYLFTMKTNGDARLSCKVFRGKESSELMTQVFRRIPGGRPFTVRWEAGSAQEGQYALVCNGYFLDTNQPLHQTVLFFHRPTAR